MREERLLERLINRSDFQEPKEVKTRENRLLNSVIQHLRRILNTRQGTVLIDPEYGIPDFSNLPKNFASPETEAIREIIHKIVEKYEPRLKDVEVIFQGSSEDDLNILFGLTGIVVHKEEKIPLRLITRLSSDLHIEINPENESS